VADSFQIGDLVTLKSGSPPMTITAIIGDAAATARFHGTTLHQSDPQPLFHLAALTSAHPPRR